MITSSNKNILIVKNRGLGDALMGLSSVSYVKTLYPNANIIYGVPSWVAPVFKNMTTDADQIVSISLNSINEYWKFFKNLNLLDVNFVHELHAAGRSQKFFKFYSKIKSTRYFFHNHQLNIPDKSKKNYDQGVLKPLIQRDLDGIWSTLKNLGYIIGEAPPDYLKFPPKAQILNTSPCQKIIFGMVGTRKTKLWPIENFKKLADLIQKKFPNYKIIIPLSNSSLDRETESEIMKSNFPDNSRIIKCSLEKIPLEVAGSKLYIGNDTGLKHLCVSLGIKTHTFFGPESPFEWHPYDTKMHSFSFVENLECRTKQAHYCGIEFCDSLICLKKILPEDFNLNDLLL